jgi:hypothetical protein
MTRVVRIILALEAAAFAAAALVHSGMLVRGHEHWKAATAESVIAVVLLAGLLATVVDPRASRGIGLAVQAFALLGTAVGIFTIVIGVGPRSALDFAFHAGFVAALVTGLVVVSRGRLGARPQHA